MITIKNVEFKKTYTLPNGYEKIYFIYIEPTQEKVNVFDVYNQTDLPKLWKRQEANLVVSQISLTLFDNHIEARVKCVVSSSEFPQCYANYGTFDSCVACVHQEKCEAKKNGVDNE